MGTGGSGTTQLDKTKDKQLGKHNHINNYFKCKWTKHYVKGRDSQTILKGKIMLCTKTLKHKSTHKCVCIGNRFKTNEIQMDRIKEEIIP